MYKALFCLCVAAVVADDVIDCTSGTIDPSDVLSITGAPHSPTDCQNNCLNVCGAGSTVPDCLSADDTLAGCAFDVANAQSNIPASESCEAGPIGQWVVLTQEWSTMTKVTISFEGHGSIEKINVGPKGTDDCVPDTTSPATCTAGECDITEWIQTQTTGQDLTVVATDESTPATDLNSAAATVTWTTKMYGESYTCKSQTSESDCGNAGCNWCYDETPRCGANPSVCVEDGTSSTTPTSSSTSASTTTSVSTTSSASTTITTSAGADGTAGVFVAVMTSALLFKFM